MPPTEQSATGFQTMTIDTNLGPITAKIDRSKAPCTAASFTYLASKNFFDNTQVPPPGDRGHQGAAVR